MGVPPPEDAGSTKSRELYGNRVAALGKGRPTAPGNSGNRAVTSPPTVLAAASCRTPDKNAAVPTTPYLTTNPISHSVSPSTPPSRRSSSGIADRPASALDVVDGSDETQQAPAERADDHHEITVQPSLTGAQPESLPETQSAKPSKPIDSTTKSTAEPDDSPPPPVSSVNSPPSTGSVVTTVTRHQTSAPLKVTVSELKVTPTQAENVATSLTPSSQSTPATVGSQIQERSPLVSAEPAMPTVEAHITVEPNPAKEAAINANLRGSRLDLSAQNDSLTVAPAHSDPPSVTDGSKGRSASNTPNAPTANKVKASVLSDNSSTPASSITLSSNIPSAISSVSGDLDASVATSPPPPTVEPSRPSFSAIVHRGDGDLRPDSIYSIASRASTTISRPSSSSFKPGPDGGVVRSKRNFKHLGAVSIDPPVSPGVGDLGTGDLAALLQEAAWLEQRLSDEFLSFDVPSVTGEKESKAGIEPTVSPSTVTNGGHATPSPHTAATSTRTKGRGLTLGSSTSAPLANTPHSPIRSSTSAPSFQVHPATSNSPEEISPIPPKSARSRKYFSLRGALRGQRLSMSSEMSSDDSAPVATPPSPNFDFSMPQATFGLGNDTMSVRSMFSSRSNRSGKSDSVPGSLRLSPPRRSVSRASSFAERLLGRALKTKSMLDDPGELSPRSSRILRDLIRYVHVQMTRSRSSHPYFLPSSQNHLDHFSQSHQSRRRQKMEFRSTAKFSTHSQMYRQKFRKGRRRICFPFRRRQRPQNRTLGIHPLSIRHSSIIQVSTSENGSHDKASWLRKRQES